MISSSAGPSIASLRKNILLAVFRPKMFRSAVVTHGKSLGIAHGNIAEAKNVEVVAKGRGD